MYTSKYFQPPPPQVCNGYEYIDYSMGTINFFYWQNILEDGVKGDAEGGDSRRGGFSPTF
jgi:hypothetical protein